MAGNLGDGPIGHRDIHPTVAGSDAVIHSILGHIRCLQRKFQLFAGAVGAVRAGPHVSIGMDLSISHDNDLRADGAGCTDFPDILNITKQPSSTGRGLFSYILAII